MYPTLKDGEVSTHSHPKVAAGVRALFLWADSGFNTQPPEGGCAPKVAFVDHYVVSTHSHPKVAAS